MPFIGTVLLLASLVSFIMIPLMVGHGLAVHQTSFILVGLAFGALGAVLVFIFSRAVRSGGAHG